MSARTALKRMGTGSDRILRRTGPALWPGEWREGLARWVILGIVGSIIVTAVYLHPWVLYVAVTACAVATYGAGRPTEDSDEDEQLEFEAEPLHPEDVADLVRDTVAGRNGALLTELLDAVEEAWPGYAETTRDVRALLGEAGIPVREGVRVKGAGNGPGVHHRDVPAPPSPTPSEAPVGVVDAGQDANTNTNNVDVTEWASGAYSVTPARKDPADSA